MRGIETAVATSCKICGGDADYFDVVDSGKGALRYPYLYGLSGVAIYLYRCRCCGFFFRKDWDGWTHDHFKEMIYNQDYVKFDPEYHSIRPRRLASYFAGRFGSDTHALHFLDYGAGTANFSAEMKRHGYVSVENYDPFSNKHPARPEFDVIVSTEVFEHLPDPVAEVASMLSLLKDDGAIFFTTCLQPGDIALQRGQWIYAAPRNGHGSFYTEEALHRIAQKFAMRCFTDGATVHCFLREGNALPKSTLAGMHEVERTFVLYAPADGYGPKFGLSSLPGDWHGIENREGLPYRWSEAASLRWELPPECAAWKKSKFILPTLFGMSPTYKERVRLRMAGQTKLMTAKATWYGMELCAAGCLPADQLSIDLDEDLCVVPGGRDMRRLGIAVPTSDAQLALP